MDLGGAKSYAQGRFLVQSTIGTGSMGIVYDVLDTERRMRVALKTLLRIDSDSLYYFKKEFRSLHDLVHPNLCSFFELINDNDIWFLTMELIDGVDFLTYVTKPSAVNAGETTYSVSEKQVESRILKAREKKDLLQIVSGKKESHSFDEEKLRRSLEGLCGGLNALHTAGKIHRDIKPSNVMVTGQGRVVLLDFGLAVEKETTRQSRNSGIVGTVAYMAPEQASEVKLGPEADWYSVGVILYVALTGNLPFRGEPIKVIFDKQNYDPQRPRLVNPRVPEDLDDLCMNLLNRDPAARPAAVDILNMVKDQTRQSFSDSLTTTTSRVFSDQTPFVGRQHELMLLKKARETSLAGSLEVVVIEGVSGVGKSALIDEFTEDVVSSDPRAVILRGRCYEHESAPFKAFDGIIESFVNYLRGVSKKEAARLKPRHTDLLVRLFPALMRVDQFFDTPISVAGSDDPQELQIRAFNALLEVLNRLSKKQPVMVVIDDVQWADSDSLTLLGHLAQSSDAPPLLLILVGRFAKNAENSVLDWDSVATKNHKRIHLKALSAEESAELVRRCIPQGENLNVDPESIAIEASGHPLYIAELVHHISQGAEDWKSLRLDDVIWSRIAALPEMCQQLLETVCFAGTPIERGHLQSLHCLSSEDFLRSVSLLRAGNLIRSRGPRKNHLIEPYHDRVREAVALHSFQKDKAADLHLRLGRLLCETYSPEELDENIYQVTRHLNEGQSLIANGEERQRLCELNLRAGIKAKSASAYTSAFDYFTRCIECIERENRENNREGNWGSDYALNLELHTKMAETGFLVGDRQLMNAHCRAVIENATDLLDQVKVYEIMIQEAEARSDVKSGVEISLEILKQLGVEMPLRPGKLRVVRELLKTKKLLRGLDAEDILSAPEMSNPRAKAIVQISHRTSAIMYFISKNLMAINVFMRLRYCLRYGNTPASICVFASYAIICCGILRKFDEGYKYGRLSLELLSKYSIDEYRGAALFRFYSFISFWKEPLENGLHPLKESFYCCIDTGDFSTAAYPAFNYAYMSLLVGRPMQDYLDDIDDFINGLQKIGEQNGLRVLLSFRQFADNAINKKTRHGTMEGPYYDEKELTPIYHKEDNRTGLYTVIFMKMLLAYLFEEDDEAHEYGKQCQQYLDGVVSTYIESLFYYYDSLILMAMWGKLSRKEKKTAKKKISSNLKLLVKFKESAEVNYQNKVLLVQAEQARIKGREAEAGELYQSAVDSALENGFLGEAATACELYAKLLLARGDQPAGVAWIEKAIVYYESWGASAKVAALKAKYSR